MLKKISSKNVKEKSRSGSSKKRKPYKKITLEKHSDIQLWAFGTMGG